MILGCRVATAEEGQRALDFVRHAYECVREDRWRRRVEALGLQEELQQLLLESRST